MYKHILIASDGSELAQKAVEQGLALAKVLDAKVLAVTVTEPLSMVAPGEVALAFPIDEYEKGVAATAAEILSGVAEAAKVAGVPCETLHIKDSYPAEGIVEAAGQHSCDLIVMASHGRRGLRRLVLGSQANEVVTHSTIPVLICR
jgi:nucleotide-binding universal stress UspA family protein